MAKRKEKDLKTRIWENPWAQLFIYVLIIVLLIWAVYYLRSILLPVVFALFFAYLLDPIVSKLDKPYLPRGLVSGLLVVILIFLFVLVLTIFLPQLFDQVLAFAQDIPSYIGKLEKIIDPVIKKFQADYPVELEKLTKSVAAEIEKKLPDIANGVTNFVLGMFTDVLSFILSLIKLIIIPIFTFFFLKDYQKIRESVKEYLPVRYKDQIIQLVRDVDRALGQYIRGQLLICIIVGTYYSIGFVIIGVPFGLLLGILIGIVNFVPYLGIFVGVIPAILLTFLEYGTFSKVLFVLILYAAQQVWDGLFLTPNILGSKVGLHPVIVLLALMIFGKVFGILGLLVAVPSTAVLKVLTSRALEKYKAKQVQLQ